MLLIDSTIFGTSDAVVVLRSNPSCSDVSHLEVDLLSWWRSLEIEKVHNQATAILTEIHPQFHTLVLLRGKTSSVQTSGVYAILPS